MHNPASSSFIARVTLWSALSFSLNLLWVNPSRTIPLIVLRNLAATLFAGVLLGGCASTAPKPKFTQAMSPEAKVIARDTVNAKVSAAPGVTLLDSERERIAQQIVSQVRTAAGAGARNHRDYEIAVTLTRYDKGSAFGRMMLAGLGQIHIDGQVSVYQLPGRAKVAEFTASKTFAWGGAYGGSVTIESIEQTFAQIIASAVCNQR